MMVAKKKITLLIGSSRVGKSTSASICEYMEMLMSERGFTTQTVNLSKAIKTVEGASSLIAAMESADVILLATPLYAAHLPSHVISACELISRHRNSIAYPTRPMLAVIANCGHPEPENNQCLIDMVQVFCEEAGFMWGGGISLGWGGAINGSSLRGAGPWTDAKTALTMAADAFSACVPIPDDAIRIASNSPMPSQLYVQMGNLDWVMRSARSGALTRLYDKPHSRK